VLCNNRASTVQGTALLQSHLQLKAVTINGSQFGSRRPIAGAHFSEANLW
jgi:hypothetical protein